MHFRTPLAIAALSLLLGYMPLAATHAQQTPQPEQQMDTALAMASCNHFVEPVYPVGARAAGIEGTVWVEAHIGPDGRVHQVKAISGPAELRQAAIDSAMQWTFILLNRTKGPSRPDDYAGAVAQIPVEFQLPVPSPIAEERSPLSIAALPQAIRADLAARGCDVPRYVGNGESGYVKGGFRSLESQDFAVVCHNLQQKSQVVLVYSSVNDIWKAELIDSGEYGTAPGDYSCYAEVDAAPPARIREYANAFETVDGRNPISADDRRFLATLDHDSVEVGLCEKVSIDYYFDGSRWRQLVGAD